MIIIFFLIYHNRIKKMLIILSFEVQRALEDLQPVIRKHEKYEGHLNLWLRASFLSSVILHLSVLVYDRSPLVLTTVKTNYIQSKK